MSEIGKKYRSFYDSVDRAEVYTTETDPHRHPFYDLLSNFIEKWNLYDKKCLEIGSAKGLFQDMVADYTGIDVSESLSTYYHKPYFTVPDARLPFPDASFDAIFTYATHEHIPDIDISLQEIARLLKPGGVCLFAPAWHTRSWFACGYQVRRYSDLNWKDRLIKLSIPVRDFPLLRWPITIMRRALHLLAYFSSGKTPGPVKYRRLTANYENYWQADSDACNSLDPFDVIIWFRSRKFRCHGYENLFKALFVRTLALELQRPLL